MRSSRMVATVLRKKNVPEDEIQDLVDKIERKDHVGLFEEFKGFDVQEERRKTGIMRAMGEYTGKAGNMQEKNLTLAR